MTRQKQQRSEMGVSVYRHLFVSLNGDLQLSSPSYLRWYRDILKATAVGNTLRKVFSPHYLASHTRHSSPMGEPDGHFVIVSQLVGDQMLERRAHQQRSGHVNVTDFSLPGDSGLHVKVCLLRDMPGTYAYIGCLVRH